MLTRRQIVLGFVALGGSLMRARRAAAAASLTYDEAVGRTWRHAEGDVTDGLMLRRELVRYATLAPSSHNTQCWKFRLDDAAISIAPDFTRRCPAVDPDDHHLYVSLGCAAENLVQAAHRHGLKGTVRYDTAADAVRVALERTRPLASPLFAAIPQRQCARVEYDGKPLSGEELRLLEEAGTGAQVRVLLLTDTVSMERVLEYVVQGNTAQMNDPAFMQELKAWIRFSGSEAVRTGDGLFAGASGSPSVPRWVGSALFALFFTTKSENDKYARHIRSSAGIAVFVSETSDKAHWLEAGRCYERFALQATALGIRNAHLNQPVEVSALRPQFASFLGLDGQRPDLIVRFGRGPEMPRSLRRPLEAVLV